MRRRTLGVSLGASLLAVFLTGCIGFTVQKDVKGDDPASPHYVVRIECDNADPAAVELVFTGIGLQPAQFDAIAPGTVNCLVHETEDADADDVDVKCGDPLPPDVICTRVADRKLSVTINNVNIETDITIPIKVTNEYDPPETTTTTTTTTTAPVPPPTASGAVAASPTFTG
jgi:hypothetical protein